MATETETAGPWRGARPTETERGDSSGRLGGGEAALTISGAIGLADHAAIYCDQQIRLPRAGAVTLAPSSRLLRAADLSAGAEPATAFTEPVDPIVDLIAHLVAAAETGTPLSLAGRVRVTVRRAPAGFAVRRGNRP